MEKITVDVMRDEAEEVRRIICKHVGAGVWPIERRRWFLWVRFTVTGPAAAVAAVQSDVDEWRDAKIIENAW